MALTFNQVKPTTVSQEQVPAPKNENGMANVTIRVDADCFLLCDGEFMEEIEIVANQIKKAQLPIGQHILEFIDATNPDVKLEKEVDFPEEGKNYLVLIKGLQEAGSKAKENAAKAEAEKQMRLEAERKAKEEAVRKAKEEAERKAKEEAERKAKEEAERKAQEEAERKAKEEAERKAKEEAVRKAKEEAVRKAKEEAERKAKETVRKAKEEAERKAKEAVRKAKEEAERKAKEAAERKAKEEAVRKAKEEAVRKLKEEAERNKLKKIEVNIKDIHIDKDDSTVIRVMCNSKNIYLDTPGGFDAELVLIDILTGKQYTISKKDIPNLCLWVCFEVHTNTNALPSKCKCQVIIRWAGDVIATSEFYELVRKSWKEAIS